MLTNLFFAEKCGSVKDVMLWFSSLRAVGEAILLFLLFINQQLTSACQSKPLNDAQFLS